MNAVIASSAARVLVALDIDGTLIDSDRWIPPGTVEALDLARAAGHEIVLATGRSLAGLLPIATRLGLTHGWAVCSNGALTVHLDRTAPSGYGVVEARTFDPAAVISRALDVAPSARIAVEEVGWGWRTSSSFEPSELNGQQKTVQISELKASSATRSALNAPEIRRSMRALRTTGVTVAPQRPDWLDITAPGVNKAVALDVVRTHLGVSADRTVAVGDGINDLDMLAWAGRSVAMGQAPANVRSAADQATGSIEQAGVLPVLASLVPVLDDTLSPLAAQIATAELDRSRASSAAGLARRRARPNAMRGLEPAGRSLGSACTDPVRGRNHHARDRSRRSGGRVVLPPRGRRSPSCAVAQCHRG